MRALDRGIKRVVAVWHRRAGKEKTFLNHTVKAAFQRVGTYFYIFPTYAQGKKILWQGKDREGFPFMSHIPKEVIKKKNEQDMRVELINDSAIQVIGSDNIDSIVGTNAIGCVFSEYALQDPRAWDYLRPILRENGGWAIFDFTPRGKNHGWEIYEIARDNPEWFCEILSIDDTGVLTEADMDAERRDGMAEEMIQQEYYCSFEGINVGSVFGKALLAADKAGRICSVPFQQGIVVDTWWDPGYAFAVWFTQTVGRGEIHVIDFYDGTQGGPDEWGPELQKRQQELGYIWGTHHGPSDLDHPQYAANGKTTRQLMNALGFEFDVAELVNLEDQIRAGNRIMPRCYFDKEKTAAGRRALMSYHFAWNDDRKCYGDKPVHDWSSHAASAWMQLGIGHKIERERREEAEEAPPVYTPGQEEVAWMGM